eukprot:3582073-Rhodomonas_salina.1
MEREEEMAGRSEEEGGEDRPPVSMQDVVNTAESMGREKEMAGQSREAGSPRLALSMVAKWRMKSWSGKQLHSVFAALDADGCVVLSLPMPASTRQEALR